MEYSLVLRWVFSVSVHYRSPNAATATDDAEAGACEC